MSTWMDDPGTLFTVRSYAAHALQRARAEALAQHQGDPERNDWSVNSRTYQNALRTIGTDSMDKLADANRATSKEAESYCLHAARVATAAHELIRARYIRLIQLRNPDHGPHTRYSRITPTQTGER